MIMNSNQMGPWGQRFNRGGMGFGRQVMPQGPQPFGGYGPSGMAPAPAQVAADQVPADSGQQNPLPQGVWNAGAQGGLPPQLQAQPGMQGIQGVGGFQNQMMMRPRPQITPWGVSYGGGGGFGGGFGSSPFGGGRGFDPRMAMAMRMRMRPQFQQPQQPAMASPSIPNPNQPGPAQLA